jgi:hypothetical protein
LIRHPVFLFLDSGQRTTLVRVRRNDKTAASRGECTQRDSIDEELDMLEKMKRLLNGLAEAHVEELPAQG